MAVTDYQSLYGICNKVALSGVSSLENIGGYETYIDLYTQDDIDKNYNDIIEGNYDEYNNLITKCSFGSDADESHIVLITSDNIEIPENYTLTPINPKKSLVIMCNKFINNGTVSMAEKGPNILPHDYYIIGQSDGYDTDIVIPAYANNQVPATYRSGSRTAGINGNNGVNRQCGSGGTGGQRGVFSFYGDTGASGSGYAFGGGAGSGSSTTRDSSAYNISVDEIYPMRGTNATNNGGYDGVGSGGIGNTSGSPNWTNGSAFSPAPSDFGVGGRIVIFCKDFINNGIITVNGTSNTWTFDRYNCTLVNGGASGAGAIDIFYSGEIGSEGTITANGGKQAGQVGSYTIVVQGGTGGNGSITFTKYSAADFVLPGYANKETIGKVIELTKKGLSIKADKTELPTKLSQLENDKGFVGRFITPKEVRTIWQDTEV